MITRRALILFLCLVTAATGRLSAFEKRPAVVATTTMIRSMIELLAGDYLEVHLLVPPASCPGHFDLKPSDAALLSRAGLIIRHDFQGYLDRKLTAQNSKIEILVLETPGHFVIPANYLSGLSRVRQILLARFPELAGFLERNFEEASGRIERAEREARARIAGSGLPGTRALASARQAEFLQWVGMEVLAAFPNSPEELSVFQLKELVDSARAGQAALVAGNLQGGGPLVAKGIAAELGIPLCILSNFPGTDERNTDYFGLLKDNLELLIRTLPESVHP